MICVSTACSGRRLFSQIFDSGRDDINDFFLNDASVYQEEPFRKIYVFVLEEAPGNIIAAFIVANANKTYSSSFFFVRFTSMCLQKVIPPCFYLHRYKMMMRKYIFFYENSYLCN